MRTVYFDIDDQTKELKDIIAKNKQEASRFHEKFEVSWIYHENALEGVVLDVFDLKAALDHASLEDGILIPVYQRIRNHKNAIEKVRKSADTSTRMPTLTYIKDLHQVISYGLSNRQGGVYRKDIPIHRTYYHEILPPGRISYQMNKLIKEMKTKGFRQFHPFRQAAEIHFRLMHIYPFDSETGKVARLAMNYFILQAGYLPVIIPSMERQHYYDALRVGPQVLHDLIVNCMEHTIALSLRLFEEGGYDII
ncbi:MAG: Fic family protein [Deltaproteobacteria bacterium]|nr:Fic family protein [Deltaproteobacteria bacterium]